MTWIPNDFYKLSTEEIENYKGRNYNSSNYEERVCRIQGSEEGQPYKCSYCDSKEVRYTGSIWIGGIGGFFYLACEKCKKKGDKIPRSSGEVSELSSKWGYQGSGGLKGNGRGQSITA